MRRRFILVVAMTLVRIPLAAAFAVLMLCTEASGLLLWTALGLLGLIELTDIFDGVLARKLDVVSEAGAVMDPWADSISRLIVFWALAVAGIVPAVLPLVMALRDVTVSYCRIVITRRGSSAGAKLSGKIKAVIQGGGAILLTAGPLYLEVTGPWVLPAASWFILVVTVISAVEYIAAASKK